VKIPRPRLGLLGRIALSLAAVGLLPVAIFSVDLVRSNQDALLEQVQRTHAVAATTAAERAGAFLATRESLARGAAANPALADPEAPAAQELLRGSLQGWADLGVLAIAVLAPNGEEVVRAQLRGEGERGVVDAALRAPGPDRTVTMIGQNPAALRITAPLAGGGGFLALVCDGVPLLDMVRPAELGDQADLLIARRDGQVVAGTIGSVEGFPADLRRTALSGQLSGAGRFPQGEEEILGAYAPVPGSDWVVLSRQPTRVAEAVAARVRRRTTLALGAAGLLIVLLSAAAWGSVVRPIRDLVAAQRSLAGVTGASAGDEISDLRRTFDLLKRSISDRQSLDDVFLGRYRVVEALGSGAMGSVFRGQDPRLRRPVALKTIRLGPELEPERRKVLLDTLTREGVTLARLSHPNVVAVYDLEDAPDGAFIAMELVEGANLEGLLWRRVRLRPDEAVPLGAAIARGLAAAHAQGIVHRDVKPANVLLGRDGSIKVTDFGIAGYLAAASDETDTVFGTPGYLPPETLMGQGYGKAGDLFSLGVLLYRCLTGVSPFPGEQVEDLLRSTLFGQIRPLREKVPAIPADLDTLVMLLLARDPGQRPGSAAAVATELDRIAAAGGFAWKLDEWSKAETDRGPVGTLDAVWVPTTMWRAGEAPTPGT
jgi:serine/threonine-protein kinase